MEKTFKLELTETEINQIWAALSEMPAKNVRNVMNKLEYEFQVQSQTVVENGTQPEVQDEEADSEESGE